MGAQRFAVASLALLASCSAAIAQDPALPTAQAYIPAQPIDRPSPTYPGSALDSAKEGWVMVSFVISPTGEVTERRSRRSSSASARTFTRTRGFGG